MPIDTARQVYLPSYNTLARPVTFHPLQSRPDVTAYEGRGIYNTEPMDVEAENMSIFSDTRTVIDILEYEFEVLPVQGDRLTIPAVAAIPSVGDFEIIETKSNGGGETTLALRRIVVTKP